MFSVAVTTPQKTNSFITSACSLWTEFHEIW